MKTKKEDSEQTGLIDLAKNGDAKAFEALWVLYKDLVLKAVIAYLPKLSDVEDLVQEVAFKTWRKISEYRSDKGAFSSWIYNMSKNACIDFLRHQDRMGRLENAWESTKDTSTDARFGDPDMVLLIRRIAHEAFGETEGDRLLEIIRLSSEGYPYREITARMGLSMSALKSRACRGKLVLRKRLCALNIGLAA